LDVNANEMTTNSNRIVYYDAASDEVRMRLCDQPPYNRNCSTSDERALKRAEFDRLYPMAYGAHGYEVSAESVQKIAANAEFLRQEITSGNLSGTEMTATKNRLRMLDRLANSLEKAVYLRKKIFDSEDVVELPSTRRDFQLLTYLFVYPPEFTYKGFRIFYGGEFVDDAPENIENQCARFNGAKGARLLGKSIGYEAYSLDFPKYLGRLAPYFSTSEFILKRSASSAGERVYFTAAYIPEYEPEDIPFFGNISKSPSNPFLRPNLGIRPTGPSDFTVPVDLVDLAVQKNIPISIICMSSTN
jgi:hypothetical protein